MTTEGPSLRDVLDHYGVDTSRSNVKCPVHDETDPSCSVNYERGLWKCHSCGAGGDAWSLIMKKEGVDFSGAVEWSEANLGAGTGETGESVEFVRGSMYGRGRQVAKRKGNRRGGRAYVPSWRRG